MCYVVASTFKKRIKHPPGHAPCDSYKISDRRKSDQWIPAVFFCALKYGSQFFWLYRKVKRGMLNAKKKDHYQIWQGRNPDGGYGGGVPEVLPAMVAAEKEGTEERELAEKVFGEEMSVCEFARQKGENRRTLALHKK